MLIEFRVGNFRSIKDQVTLSLLAASQVSEYKDENTFFMHRHRLLKSAVIYGANASGKSNLLGAFVFMRWFLLSSSKESQAEEEINVNQFKLDSETQSQPSFFEVTFLLNDLQYRYGFEADKKTVKSEWLFYAEKEKEYELFLREDDKIRVFDKFSEGKDLEEKTRNNALFLSVVANFNGDLAIAILKWFREINLFHGLHESDYTASIELLKDKKQRKQFINFLRNADLDIADIHLGEKNMEVPDELLSMLSKKNLKELRSKLSDAKNISINTEHIQYSAGKPKGKVMLDFEKDESDGTKKFFRLLGPMIQSLCDGKIIIADELEARLHPLLTEFLVRLFLSPETNPKNAQLIFVTHDTNLLQNTSFRRDQIWFAEKSQQQATDLYSLAEIKVRSELKVRKDASFAKDYIQGKYGAIPFIGDFEGLCQGKD